MFPYSHSFEQLHTVAHSLFSSFTVHVPPHRPRKAPVDVVVVVVCAVSLRPFVHDAIRPALALLYLVRPVWQGLGAEQPASVCLRLAWLRPMAQGPNYLHSTLFRAPPSAGTSGSLPSSALPESGEPQCETGDLRGIFQAVPSSPERASMPNFEGGSIISRARPSPF